MTAAGQDYGETVERLAEGLLEAEGLELVAVECLKMKSRWLVRLFMDKEGGVTLDDCTGISQQLGDLLDVHDVPPGPYTLEVSSPGLNRPLVKDRDFLRYRGRTVDLRLSEKWNGMRHLKGRLIDYGSVEGETVLTIETAGKIHALPKRLVAKAHLEYEITDL